MKKLAILCGILYAHQVIGQNIVTTVPTNPSLDDNVVVTYDASAGNKRLQSFQGDVYIHTGVITNQSKNSSDWKYVQTPWGTADNRWKMTPIGNHQYTFNLGNLRNFYHLAATEQVLQLAFVFRNANGSMIGKHANNADIFVPVQTQANSNHNNGAIVLTTAPSNPSLDDQVTITFDASAGNKRLQDFQGDIFIHTGLITSQSKNSSDWKYIQTQWGVAESRWKMTPLGNHKYSFQLGNLRNFYHISANEQILQLAFVFRNANGSLIGKHANNADIFMPVRNGNTAVNNTSSSNNVIVNNNGRSAHSNSTMQNNSPSTASSAPSNSPPSTPPSVPSNSPPPTPPSVPSNNSTTTSTPASNQNSPSNRELEAFKQICNQAAGNGRVAYQFVMQRGVKGCQMCDAYYRQGSGQTIMAQAQLYKNQKDWQDQQVRNTLKR
jgi:hypothetical protein